MTPDAIYKVIRRTGTAANLSSVNPEMLRRTGLRLAMEAGATTKQVQVHGRLKSASSVEQLRADNQHNRLSESAVDLIDLDI
jgi:integrase